MNYPHPAKALQKEAGWRGMRDDKDFTAGTNRLHLGQKLFHVEMVHRLGPSPFPRVMSPAGEVFSQIRGVVSQSRWNALIYTARTGCSFLPCRDRSRITVCRLGLLSNLTKPLNQLLRLLREFTGENRTATAGSSRPHQLDLDVVAARRRR